MANIRTRFAPSPTGYLHIGGLRTALFAYLVAKTNDGKVFLRIEDTDQKREVAGAVDKLKQILDWVGLKFDEGPGVGGDYGPYTQTERIKIYQQHAEKLINTGKAYRCFCTSERLTQMREEQQKEKLPPRYDKRCRNLEQAEIEKKLANNESFVIRQKMPKKASILAYDELRGEIEFQSDELDDHVLMKSNSVPTYQLAVVVDDHLMEVSHVVRGEEWISSFPKNLLLYNAFDWQPPKFIHLPLVLSKTGGKLSKRQGDVAVEDFRDKGYLPEALLNFCALLGWSPYGKEESEKDNKNQEIFNMDELLKKFDYNDMNVNSAVFDTDKLDFLNGYYIRQLPLEKLVRLTMPYLEDNLKKAKTDRQKSNDFIAKVVGLEQERLKKLSEIGELTKFFFVERPDYPDEMLAWKKITVEQAKENLGKIYELLEKIPEDNWTDDSIEDAIVTYLKAKELKIGEYLWPMRVSLTGKKASPGPFEVAETLGREISLERVKQAIN